jgi:hypothetical protein
VLSFTYRVKFCIDLVTVDALTCVDRQLELALLTPRGEELHEFNKLIIPGCAQQDLCQQPFLGSVQLEKMAVMAAPSSSFSDSFNHKGRADHQTKFRVLLLMTEQITTTVTFCL